MNPEVDHDSAAVDGMAFKNAMSLLASASNFSEAAGLLSIPARHSPRVRLSPGATKASL
ncbi:hypothetical protein [Streptomyces sp. S186]|uniref:hypothetical protein n=1 Tax=Streptomyces sp. S186 TaxID=3434395 RepID=UPI003F67A105